MFAERVEDSPELSPLTGTTVAVAGTPRTSVLPLDWPTACNNRNCNSPGLASIICAITEETIGAAKLVPSTYL